MLQKHFISLTQAPKTFKLRVGQSNPSCHPIATDASCTVCLGAICNDILLQLITPNRY